MHLDGCWSWLPSVLPPLPAHPRGVLGCPDPWQLLVGILGLRNREDGDLESGERDLRDMGLGMSNLEVWT